MYDAAPAALLAAALGAAGSAVLSGGSLAAAGIGGLGSAAATMLFNSVNNVGKRKMSVEQAIEEELQKL